ncbi:MAG: PDZ domain-containing protein [Clostridiales bacterium]|nr:PDZ domain-containing protein [Clostridiales bacterium]
MENKKEFLKGLGAGSLITAIIVVIAAMGITVYAKQMFWRGPDPNTKITEIYNLLNMYSIVPFDRDEMLENMYRGFVDGVGDPYTQYLDSEALASFRARTEGTFVGIGVTITTEQDDPFVTISSTFHGAPADLAGLLPGDKIMAVDGVDVAGRAIEDVVGMVTGPEGTIVTITIYRDFENERFDVEIIRATVEVPTVFHEMHYTQNGSVGYIRLEGFDGVTAGQFEAALSELTADGMEGLILDLRNNPGGLLTSVIEITDRLLPEGIITYTVDSRGNREDFRSDAAFIDLPLVLLVNGRSASASEVLSGAVRDTGRGTIIGTQTFGKGVVQNLLYLSDGTAIKLTVQTYHTPNGENIHGTGIEPHVIVEMSEDLSRRIGRLMLEEDIQLQAALEIISQKMD